MSESWQDARTRIEAALGDLVEGRAASFQAQWSRSDDTVIMGAFGGHDRGWQQVSERLEWASKGIRASGRRTENLLTVVGQDLACTVDLEHMERTSEGRTLHRILRCTQVYRLEGGRWKVIVRHADELAQKDAEQK